jgi:histidine triad (HIT) family protein
MNTMKDKAQISPNNQIVRDDSCILCKINQDSLPHLELLTSAHFKVVLDNRPITRGHLLVISRSHHAYLDNLPPAESSELLLLCSRLTGLLRHVMPDHGDCNLLINNGPQSGQHIGHVHVHLIPRSKGDSLAFYWRLLSRFINPFSPMNRQSELQKIAATWRTQLAKMENMQE